MVPGQGVAMILRQSILGGRKAAFWSLMGNSLGLLTWGTLSSVGLSAVFAKSHLAYSILKWSGVVFLVFLSLQTLATLKNEFGKFDLQSEGQVRTWPALRLGLITNLTKVKAWPAIRLGLLTNLTNVKAAVFAVAFLPQFVPRDFSLGWGIFIFGCIWPLVSTSWYLIMIWTVDKSSLYIQKPKVRRVLTAISAVGILGLAIGLALTSAR